MLHTIMTLSFVWFKYSINELCAGPTIVMSSIFRSSLKVFINGGLVGRVKLAIKHPEYAEIVDENLDYCINQTLISAHQKQ